MTTTTTTPTTTTDRTAQVIDRLQEAAAADRVFGAPIERDGTTVVPVVTVRTATARRGGPRRRRRSADGGRAAGRGDAVATVLQPAGVYVIRRGRVRWRPAADAGRLFVVGNLTAVAYFMLAWLTARARASGSVAPAERGRRWGAR